MTAWQIFSFTGQRLLQAIPLLLVIVVLNFCMIQLAPGDAADVLVGESGGATPEYTAQVRQQFGLDDSKPVQLWRYVKSVATLDLGYSFRNGAPVLDLVLQRMGPTLLLMCTSIVIAISAGIALGVIAASRVNTWIDGVISVVSLLSYATPLFWAGLMFIALFSLKLDWLPSGGMENIAEFKVGWERVPDVALHLMLPALTLSLFFMATYARLMRAGMLDQKTMDYVTTARAKGLSEKAINMRHILKNAVLPVVTTAGVQVGTLLGGSIVVETVFAWPGMGLLAFQALAARDLNLLLGIFLLSACLVVIVNILIDLVYFALDPRIRA